MARTRNRDDPRWRLNMSTYEALPPHYVIPGSHLVDPPGALLWVDNTSTDVIAEWTVSSSTTSGDPGSSHMRFNTAPQGNATAIYVSKNSVSGLDISAALLQTPTKLFIQRKVDATRYGRWTISNITNNTSWFSLTIVSIGSAGLPLLNNDAAVLLFRW